MNENQVERLAFTDGLYFASDLRRHMILNMNNTLLLLLLRHHFGSLVVTLIANLELLFCNKNHEITTHSAADNHVESSNRFDTPTE